MKMDAKKNSIIIWIDFAFSNDELLYYEFGNGMSFVLALLPYKGVIIAHG